MSGGELRHMAGNPALVAGLLGTVALIGIGIFGEMLAPYDPNAGVSVLFRYHPDGNYSFKIPPTLPDDVHWFGTDALGRDQFSRLLAGAKLTLTLVLAATVLRLGIGVALGLVSGWYHGWTVRVAGVIGSGVSAIPQLLLAVILVLALRDLGPIGFVFALALVGWPEVAEFTRGEAQRVKLQPYIEAASALGAPGRRLITRHLVPALGPQLLTVAALEVGAVLILLAELGLLGIFLAGFTNLLGEYGTTHGTLKERAPEWGQMLGTIQFFAITEQLGTLIPALFVVLAAMILATLAEGLRAASDPFSAHRLSPRAFGGLAKVLAAALCVSAVGFVGIGIPVGPLTMEEGRLVSGTTAQRMWPGSVAVAVVARYESLPARADGAPDRLTFYYRNQYSEVLRISFENADRLSVEVRQYETQDELDFRSLNPLPPGLTSYQLPLAVAESAGGEAFRRETGVELVRVIVAWPPDRSGPAYSVRYGARQETREWCCVDALTGQAIEALKGP